MSHSVTDSGVPLGDGAPGSAGIDAGSLSPALALVHRIAERVFPVALVCLATGDRPPVAVVSHLGEHTASVMGQWASAVQASEPEGVVVVADATEDPRWKEHELVTGPPHLRFYAGLPLVSADGTCLGVLGLVDTTPRESVTEADMAVFQDLASLMTEMLEVRRHDEERQATQARFENIAQTSPDAIMCADARGSITFWNASAAALFGYSVQEMLGSPVLTIIPDHEREQYYRDVERLMSARDVAGVEQRFETHGQRKDGSVFPAELSLSAWPDGASVSMGAIVRDATERKQHEAYLSRLASTDSLTGLLNRASLRDVMAGMIESGTPFTVALVDLDGFKDVNDTLGHFVGDVVITHVAKRILRARDDAAAVGRLGGDEFVVIVDGDDAAAALELGRTLVDAVSGAYVAADQRVELGASVGLAVHPADGLTAEAALGAADLALYRAKDAGRSSVMLFDASMREDAVAQRALRKELSVAFRLGQFELFYQPQFGADGSTLTGAEALIRWRHPVRGLLTPATFLDALAAESSVRDVGEWILRTACSQAAVWRAHVPDLRMGVNLFGAQLRDPRLVERVERALADAGLPGSALELEIVETIIIGDDAATLQRLADLRALGVHIAFDDYGTGFASLSGLKRYPVSRLKIDRAFVRHVDTDHANAAVVSAVLDLARTFGLGAIAEGIETADELSRLRELGCGGFQGFLFGVPMSSHEFESTLLGP